MSTTLSGWESATATATIDVAGIYERHAPEIHDFLARTVHDHATAEDLTQATFIRLMERGDTVREADKVRPWLFTVAHNLAVTHVTRRRPADPIEAALAIASGDKGPAEAAESAEAARLVWDAARSLEPRQYAVLDLTVRRGFSVAEIAEVLEITPAHAAVVVHRAREALAQAIRLLVVVRQRRHCARLAELIPEGTEVLTPDLRATADRHMRRCEVCKEVGEKLTDPVELLGLLPLLPLPLAVHPYTLFPGLAHAHAAAAAAAAHAAAGHGAAAAAGGAAGAATAGRAQALVSQAQQVGQRAGQLLGQPAVLAGVIAVAIAGAGGGLGIALHGGSHERPPTTAAKLQGGLGGGAAVIPPLTAGPPPGTVVTDGRQGAGAQHDNTAESTPGAIPFGNDVVVVLPAPPPTNPPAPPPSPAPSPLINLHPRTTDVSPSLPYAGADVVVYNPTDPSAPPPYVNVIPPPVPANASHFHSS